MSRIWDARVERTGAYEHLMLTRVQWNVQELMSTSLEWNVRAYEHLTRVERTGAYEHLMLTRVQWNVQELMSTSCSLECSGTYRSL